jgi:orotate phosphoribosyltransferase
MTWPEERRELGRRIVEGLYEHGLIRTWFRDRPEGWTLVSGLWSPFYIQLRPLCSYPDLLADCGRALGRMICEEIPEATKVVGIAMAGIPLATATAVTCGLPAAYTRKIEGVRSPEELADRLKEYGEHAQLEGELVDGDRLVLVDDLVTRLDSKLIAVRQAEFEVQRRGLQDVRCEHVAVIVDREQGAAEVARESGFGLHALTRFVSEAIPWLASKMHPVEVEVITGYLRDPQLYQNPQVRGRLQAQAEQRK